MWREIEMVVGERKMDRCNSDVDGMIPAPRSALYPLGDASLIVSMGNSSMLCVE